MAYQHERSRRRGCELEDENQNQTKIESSCLVKSGGGCVPCCVKTKLKVEDGDGEHQIETPVNDRRDFMTQLRLNSSLGWSSSRSSITLDSTLEDSMSFFSSSTSLALSPTSKGVCPTASSSRYRFQTPTPFPLLSPTLEQDGCDSSCTDRITISSPQQEASLSSSERFKPETNKKKCPILSTKCLVPLRKPVRQSSNQKKPAFSSPCSSAGSNGLPLRPPVRQLSGKRISVHDRGAGRRPPLGRPVEPACFRLQQDA